MRAPKSKMNAAVSRVGAVIAPIPLSDGVYERICEAVRDQRLPPGTKLKEVALAELKAYNAAVRTDIAFNPNIKDGRGTKGLAIPKSNWANTLDTAPYEAYAVTCGITFTFGGLRINTDAQVMSTDGLPIPGLDAAGELVGGIFYFNYPGGSGLTNGAVFGKIAGASAGTSATGKK